MKERLFTPFHRHRSMAKVVTVLLLLVPVIVVGAYLAVPAGTGANVQLVECGKGVPLNRVAVDLERRGIVRSARLFVLLARLRGEDDKVKAGTYQVNDAMTPGQILRKLVAGDVYAYRFAVPEGYSIYQLGELLENRGIFQEEDFLAACTDKKLLKELGLPGPSVEGYLYPSTYNITPRMTPADVIRMMTAKFEKVYAERFAQQAKDKRLSRHELLTLASMIEKEAVVVNEMPLIASVFANRLKRGMRLQSDPTAVYGERAFAGTVTHQDIQRKSRYNTYLIDGLPPGPIGNPGGEAIQAALAPQQTPYLYFVAKNDGTHFFSTDLDQHNRAVATYLRGSGAKPSQSRAKAGFKNDHPSLTGGR